MNITKSLKFGFSLFCRVLLLAFFFSAPVFISCLFRGDEWHNYFTSVIDLYNRLLSKIGPFKTSGEFSITNSLKFGFSLFCRVLLLAFFFVPVFISCSFNLVCFLQLLAIEKRLADFSDRQQILLKTPTMQLNKVYHGKLNRQKWVKIVNETWQWIINNLTIELNN